MAHERKEQSYLTTVSLVILAFVALAFALVYTRAVMIPFIVALFIVSLVSPVQDFQVKRLRFPRILAAALTLSLVLVMIALVSLLVTYTIQTVVSTARDYSASFAYMANKVLEPLEYMYEEETPAVPGASSESDLDDGLSAGPAVVEPGPDANAPEAAEPYQDTPGAKVRRLNAKKLVSDMQKYIFNILTGAVGTIFGLVSGVFFVIIFVMFLVAGRDPYATHSEIYANIVQKVRRYVGTKVAISLVTGLLVWVSLQRLGLPLAIVFGILAFLLNFIPSIGSVISTMLPIPVAVAHFAGAPSMQGQEHAYWGTVFLVVAIPGAIQMVMGNVIEPKLMGEGLNLHPVTVLLALSFWGLLWGVVGMLLAAPITAAIRIVLMQFDTLRPIGKLLAGDLARSEPRTK
jgi:AI-2 transport protein TqsA